MKEIKGILLIAAIIAVILLLLGDRAFPQSQPQLQPVAAGLPEEGDWHYEITTHWAIQKGRLNFDETGFYGRGIAFECEPHEDMLLCRGDWGSSFSQWFVVVNGDEMYNTLGSFRAWREQ